MSLEAMRGVPILRGSSSFDFEFHEVQNTAFIILISYLKSFDNTNTSWPSQYRFSCYYEYTCSKQGTIIMVGFECSSIFMKL